MHPRPRKKQSCVMQPSKEISCPWPCLEPTKPASILGIVMVTYQISRKDMLARKKYMGLWRLGWFLIAIMMSVFSVSTNTWASRGRANNSARSGTGAGKPSNTDSLSLPLWFFLSMVSVMPAALQKRIECPQEAAAARTQTSSRWVCTSRMQRV